MTATPLVTDTNNTNPKYLNSYLNTTGLWNLVVKHMLTTAYETIPFYVIVETQKGIN